MPGVSVGTLALWNILSTKVVLPLPAPCSEALEVQECITNLTNQKLVPIFC